MKKTLLMAWALCLSLCALANNEIQTRKADKGIMQHQGIAFNTPARSLQSTADAYSRKAPARAAETDNTRRLGLYTSDDYEDENGLGLSSLTGNYPVATLIPSEYYQKMAGGKITSIRYALTQSCKVNSVLVYTLSNDYMTTLVVEQPVADAKSPTGWNTVELETPFELPADCPGILIGYEYEQKKNAYPISLVEGSMPNSFLLYGDLGDGTGWYDFSDYGMLSVQANVECENLPAVDLVLGDMGLENTIFTSGATFQYGFSIYNFGTADIESCEVAVKLDGETVTTLTNDELKVSGTPQYYIGEITLAADIERGAHTLSAEVVSANGAAPASGLEDDKVACSFSTFMAEDIVPRQKYLIEEMTSHSCTYCPYGAAVLEAMSEMSDELAIACIHGNLSSKDPFNTDECESLLRYLGCAAYPTAAFNRIYFNDEEGLAPGIAFQQAASAAKDLLQLLKDYSAPSFASVDIEHQLDGNTLSLKVSGKGGDVARKVLDGYSLTVYVLEDSLKYRQLNNGKWINNYIHRHVFRKAATALNGDAINWISDSEYSNELTVELSEEWVKENLSVVAFISKQQPLDHPDWTDMAVSNANVIELFEKSQGGEDPGEQPEVDAGLILSPISTVNQIVGEGASPDLNYVVGFNFTTYAPMVWNTVTGEVKDYAEYEEGTFHYANNEGLAVGSDGDFALAISPEGQRIELYREEGEIVHADWGDYSTGDAGSEAWAVSADGKTIAGFYFKSDYTTMACLWDATTGLRTDLPLPAADELDFEFDGAEARWMTPDAKVIGGFLFDSYSTWPAVVWRLQEDGTYVCDPICKDYYEADYQQGKPYIVFTTKSMSDNGEWLAIDTQEEFDFYDYTKPAPAHKAARYNLVTGELQVLEQAGLEPTGISNNGSVLLFSSIEGLVGREGYIWEAGATKTVNLNDELSHVQGMPALGSNTPCVFSADGKRIEGFAMNEDLDFFSYVVEISALPNGLEQISSDRQPISTDRTFNLQGQRVRSINAPGLYIRSGRKVLVK